MCSPNRMTSMPLYHKMGDVFTKQNDFNAIISQNGGCVHQTEWLQCHYITKWGMCSPNRMTSMPLYHKMGDVFTKQNDFNAIISQNGGCVHQTEWLQCHYITNIISFVPPLNYNKYGWLSKTSESPTPWLEATPQYKRINIDQIKQYWAPNTPRGSLNSGAKPPTSGHRHKHLPFEVVSSLMQGHC